MRVVKHPETRESLCYGYVNFSKHEEANKAMQELNYQSVLEKPIRIMPFSRSPKAIDHNSNVFVKNLDTSITTRWLYEHFRTVGPIKSCKIS